MKDYNITHHYGGTGDIIASFPTLDEAKQEFARLVAEWGELSTPLTSSWNCGRLMKSTT